LQRLWRNACSSALLNMHAIAFDLAAFKHVIAFDLAAFKVKVLQVGKKPHLVGGSEEPRTGPLHSCSAAAPARQGSSFPCSKQSDGGGNCEAVHPILTHAWLGALQHL